MTVKQALGFETIPTAPPDAELALEANQTARSTGKTKRTIITGLCGLSCKIKVRHERPEMRNSL